MKKNIMIDLDDTICSGGYLDIVNQYLNTDYQIGHISTYYYEDLLPAGVTDDYLDFYNKHNVYDYVNLFEGAYDVLEKLSKCYDICICSAYVSPYKAEDSHFHLANKYQYLVKTFPFLKPANFIFTSRKDLIKCDIKIDDTLSNLKGDGTIKLLFDSYHNQSVTDQELEVEGVRRVRNWQEIGSILLTEEI